MENSKAHQDSPLGDHAVLIVFSPTPQDRAFQIQMEQISDRRNALLGHDVVVTEVFENRPSDNVPWEECEHLRQHYRVPPGHFRVVLVGKDEHVKMVADSCVSLEEVIMRVENEPVSMSISPV